MNQGVSTNRAEKPHKAGKVIAKDNMYQVPRIKLKQLTISLQSSPDLNPWSVNVNIP